MNPEQLLKSLTPRSLGVKVGMLLAATIIIAGGFVLYVLFARGTFEATQRVILIAENAEGIRVGQDLTFAGFPIGKVRTIRLREDGKVRISVRIPVDDAKWLRTSTVFMIDVPLVGTAKLRAYSSNLKDPPLEHRAERMVLRGDTAEEIPRMVASVRQVLEHLEQLVQPGSNLQESVKNARTVTERMAGKYGVLGGVLGSDDNAKKVIASIDRANSLLDQLSGFSKRLDQRVLGTDGIAEQTQKAVAQANAILAEVRESLKKVDGILADAQSASSNVKAATRDLDTLRAEVDASLRKVTTLIDEINRKWPFARETEVKLP